MTIYLKLKEVLENAEVQKKIVKEIKNNKIFVYPTDTVYGIGCNATNEEAVSKIRSMKGSKHPFSVIAPSKTWIRKNLIIKHYNYLNKLPGPYTLIFLKKNYNFLKETSDSNSIGVRIPYHPFTKIIQKSERPFITTSVNYSGQRQICKIDEIPERIKADVIIDAGELKGKPSKVIDLTKETPIVIRE